MRSFSVETVLQNVNRFAFCAFMDVGHTCCTRDGGEIGAAAGVRWLIAS